MQSMINTLKIAELELPRLLEERPAVWHSVCINYHPPTVERLWISYGEYRLNLHKIHPCSAEEALFHPHPWPTAMRVVHGEYEMAVGHGKDAPPKSVRLVGKVYDMNSSLYYEMTHPDDWHYVRPIGDVAMTIMLSGRPWNREAPRSDEPLRQLTGKERREIIDFFREFYSF